MRYLKVKVDRTETPATGVEAILNEQGEAVPERLFNLIITRNSTKAYMYRLTGNVQTAVRNLRRNSAVNEISTHRITSNCWDVYAEVCSEVQDGLLTTLKDEFPLFVDKPVEYIDEGYWLARLAGPEQTLREVQSDVLSMSSLTFLRVGSYLPQRRLDGLLTHRQREIIQVALQMGYYDFPRDTDYKSIAEQIGIDAQTVTEHIRKAEAKILPRLFNSNAGISEGRPARS